MNPDESSWDDEERGAAESAAAELFPYAMPFRAARAAGLLIAMLFAAAAVGAVVVQWPETVRAPFAVVPAGGADPLQAPFDGIVSEVRVREGDAVAQGAVLFVIRSPRVQALHAELIGLNEEMDALAEQRRAAESAHAIQQRIQSAEIEQRQRQAAFQTEYVTVYQDVARRMERMEEQGLASSVDLLNHQLGMAEARRDQSMAEQQLRMAELELERIAAEHAKILERIASEERQLTPRIAAITSQLEEADGDLVIVRAPYAGAVLALGVKQPGSVVAAGQALCRLAREDAPLQARLALEERGMARVETGQPVQLLFEAFPYQRHGMVNGAVRWMSPAADAGGFYAVVEWPAPPPYAVRAGMQGEARIHTGRRTLIEYAFEPIRKLRETMRAAE